MDESSVKYLRISVSEPGEFGLSRVIEFLRIFKFCNLHLMRGRLMLPDSISEEKLKFNLKMEDLIVRLFWCRLF